ncbi:extracellular solute-binding protein [Enterococcus saccharolyticus]|uniref:ABC transporter substrate-binding protein n=1 Tax=Enterococcus saccharolyticus TaxID=41997 RepID=UPI001E54571E|nr:ABC transporter substrate-binding protein [Enterococcus saccharolyticus]MCD5002045.1 extracellular solute-binding protein [Enterococcus saccharolyticus]
MKLWKRTLGLATMGLFATAVLGACGNGGTKESADSSDGETTLLMYQVGDKPENYDQLMEIANKRIKEKIGVTLDLQYIGWGDWDKKMPTIINSGENYDIAFASNYSTNAQKGAFADLTDLAPKYASEYMEQLPEMYTTGNQVDGKLYAIPVYGNAWAQQVLTFNKQYLDEYNIDISKVGGSYDSATEVLKAFHEKNPNVAAFAIGQSFRASGNFDYPLGKDYPFAVKIDDSGSPKIINQYEDPEFQDTLRTLRSWYEAGYIPTDAATSTTAYPLDQNTWFVREETQGPMDYGDTILSNAAGQPLVSKPLNEQLKTTSQAQMANFVVSNTSKNKEKAVEFLNLLNTDVELLNGLVYGIEGEAWEKTGDTTIKLLDGYEPNTHMAAWNTGNNMILYTQDSITEEMIKERDESIENATSSPILGFSFNQDNVKTEISSIMNVMSRYISNVNTGSVDPDTTLPKMIEDLKGAGWDTVQKEMQEQLDTFIAENQ